MKNAHQDQVQSQPAEKKPYARPELIKHGTVESQTLVVANPGSSRPAP